MDIDKQKSNQILLERSNLFNEIKNKTIKKTH